MRPRPARRASLSLARHWIAHQAGDRFVSYVSTQVRQLKADGMGPSKIAKTLGIGRASVYRALEAQ